jgi:hypothetical protein
LRMDAAVKGIVGADDHVVLADGSANTIDAIASSSGPRGGAGDDAERTHWCTWANAVVRIP